MVTPVCSSPLTIAQFTGAAPRYFGRREKWTLTQPCFGAVEAPERLVDGRQARLSDAGGLRFDLAERLFVGLPNRLPLVLQAALELMDAGGRLVEQPALDVVPLAQAAMKFDDGSRVSLVVLRPAVEDSCVCRSWRRARLTCST